MYLKVVKPFLDISMALLGFLLLFPLLFTVAIALSLANQGNPFFFQLRPGLHGKVFKIIKFKTMNDKKDALGNLLSDVQRLTKIGKLGR